MSHVDAETSLAIYRHFGKQAEHAVEFLGVAKKLQNILDVPIPDLNLKHVMYPPSVSIISPTVCPQAPVTLVGSLEEYLNDPNFEQNRIEYKAAKDAADRKPKNGRTVAKKKEEKRKHLSSVYLKVMCSHRCHLCKRHLPLHRQMQRVLLRRKRRHQRLKRPRLWRTFSKRLRVNRPLSLIRKPEGVHFS